MSIRLNSSSKQKSSKRADSFSKKRVRFLFGIDGACDGQIELGPTPRFTMTLAGTTALATRGPPASLMGSTSPRMVSTTPIRFCIGLISVFVQLDHGTRTFQTYVHDNSDRPFSSFRISERTSDSFNEIQRRDVEIIPSSVYVVS